MKNEKLNQWFWKWHCIAGLITLPFILILSITGIIYLFKADYEVPRQQHIKKVSVDGDPISFEHQWDLANAYNAKKINAVILPKQNNQATEFVSGKFGGKSSVYIDPYLGKVSGTIVPKNGIMFKVRKLHGELLLGKFGTLIIELVASWMVVLLCTGIYIWWPGNGYKSQLPRSKPTRHPADNYFSHFQVKLRKLNSTMWIKGFFIPRIRQGKRILYRDIHAITGFWFSILLLMILAGGFPWTDVFGANFKWVQKATHTGFPATWSGHQLQSIPNGKIITLDKIIAKTKTFDLPGEVRIDFPKGTKGVYSISNTYPQDLNAQQKIHLDQYSGTPLLKLHWADVGVLMRARMWFMAFHQGEFGLWNWVLVLLTAIGLLLLSITALISYLLRKRKNEWNIPQTPSDFTVGYPMIGIILLLGIVFPLFGVSVVLISGGIFIKNRYIPSS